MFVTDRSDYGRPHICVSDETLMGFFPLEIQSVLRVNSQIIYVRSLLSNHLFMLKVKSAQLWFPFKVHNTQKKN